MKKLITISIAAAATTFMSAPLQADAEAFSAKSKKCVHQGCASTWQPNTPGWHRKGRGSRTQDTNDTPSPSFPSVMLPTHTATPVPIPYPNQMLGKKEVEGYWGTDETPTVPKGPPFYPESNSPVSDSILGRGPSKAQ